MYNIETAFKSFRNFLVCYFHQDVQYSDIEKQTIDFKLNESKEICLKLKSDLIKILELDDWEFMNRYVIKHGDRKVKNEKLKAMVELMLTILNETKTYTELRKIKNRDKAEGKKFYMVDNERYIIDVSKLEGASGFKFDIFYNGNIIHGKIYSGDNFTWFSHINLNTLVSNLNAYKKIVNNIFDVNYYVFRDNSDFYDPIQYCWCLNTEDENIYFTKESYIGGTRVGKNKIHYSDDTLMLDCTFDREGQVGNCKFFNKDGTLKDEGAYEKMIQPIEG